MRYAVIYMVNCPLDKKSTFRDNRLRMQNSCRLLHNMTYNALKTSEMSRQCLNMAPAAKLQLQLHMQLQHPTSDWWHLQHERRRLECKIQLTCLSTDTCKPHTHSKMHMWVSYQFHVQSTWQTGHTTPHRLTHLPTRPLFIFRVAQEHRNLLKARCTAMAQNPGPLKQMSA